MLTTMLLRIIANAFTALISLLPNVTALPTIGGYDIDGAFISTTGMISNFFRTFWVIGDVMIAATVLWIYYGGKILARLVLGHRAPP